jgi:hypothetical protein
MNSRAMNSRANPGRASAIGLGRCGGASVPVKIAHPSLPRRARRYCRRVERLCVAMVSCEGANARSCHRPWVVGEPVLELLEYTRLSALLIPLIGAGIASTFPQRGRPFAKIHQFSADHLRSAVAVALHCLGSTEVNAHFRGLGCQISAA